MIIDGRKIAGEVLARAKAHAKELSHQPLVVAIVANETPATLSYLKIKGLRAADAGCVFETRPLGASYDDADAVIVQLPLPDGVNQKEVCDAIPLSKDADVLSSSARALFEHTDTALLPPVVAAVREIFIQNSVVTKGKKAVVIGNGFLVGTPVAMWLTKQGAEVTVIDRSNSAVARVALATADIVVSGAGSPHLIKSEMLKQGVVLIDAGTSESNGTIAGDADPACADKCSLFTPVPGGVGPLAVACLFENTVILACLRRQAEKAI